MTDTPIIYSQRDPRWASQHYGLAKAAKASTIGAFGCGITAIAQKLTLRGMATTPADVQRILCEGGGFHDWGSYNFIDWARLFIYFPHLTFNGRSDVTPSHPTPDRTMRMIRDRIESGDPCIIYVDADKFALGLQQHFVLAVGYVNNRIEILNPWNGKQQTLEPYGTPDNQAIQGAIWLDWLASVRVMSA